jgi:hypothetical protein
VDDLKMLNLPTQTIYIILLITAIHVSRNISKNNFRQHIIVGLEKNLSKYCHGHKCGGCLILKSPYLYIVLNL